MTLSELNPKRGLQHPRAFELCICGMPRWRHPRTEAERETFYPYHLFTDPDVGDDLVVLRRLPNGRFTKVKP